MIKQKTHASNDEEPWLTCWKVTDDHFGKGGQGYTKRVKHRTSNADGVLKLLKYPDRIQARKRFHREIVTLRMLEHPRIPKVLDANEQVYADEDAPLYAVYEYISGETLEQFISKRGALSLRDAVLLVKNLLNVLSYVHGEDVVHRDIKPKNIIILDNDIEKPVLIDFGIVFIDDEHDGVTRLFEPLVNTFLTLPEFLSVSGEKRSPKSDITLCVGVLFYCLTQIEPAQLLDALTNERPHEKSAAKKVLSSLTKSQLNAINLLFDIGFQHHIGQRYQSIQSLEQQLDNLLSLETAEDSSLQEDDDRLKQIFESSPKHMKAAAEADALHNARGKIYEFAYSVGSEYAQHLDTAIIGGAQIARAEQSTIRFQTKGSKDVFYACSVEARIDGTELVITAGTAPDHREVLRVPYSEFEQWQILGEELRKYLKAGLLKAGERLK